MQLRWSHAVLRVRNMDAMVDFYTNVLGFEVTDRGPFPVPGSDSPQIVFLSQVDTDHHQIAFVDKRRDENSPNSVDHFAFRVDSLDDVRAMDALLAKDGRVRDRLPLTHGNAWSIYFADPEGNGIEIFCDSPWHVQQPQVKVWDRDKSNEEVIEETRKGFEDELEFGPIGDYYEKRAKELKDRQGGDTA